MNVSTQVDIMFVLRGCLADGEVLLRVETVPAVVVPGLGEAEVVVAGVGGRLLAPVPDEGPHGLAGVAPVPLVLLQLVVRPAPPRVGRAWQSSSILRSTILHPLILILGELFSYFIISNLVRHFHLCSLPKIGMLNRKCKYISSLIVQFSDKVLSACKCSN